MGKDVLWEIHSRRESHDHQPATIPFQCSARTCNFTLSCILVSSIFTVCPTATVYVSCVCGCVYEGRGWVGVNCYFQGWHIMLLVFALFRPLRSTVTKRNHKYLNEELLLLEVLGFPETSVSTDETTRRDSRDYSLLPYNRKNFNNYIIHFTSVVINLL